MTSSLLSILCAVGLVAASATVAHCESPTPAPTAAVQTSPLAGTWSATLEAGGQKLRIQLNVKSDGGRLSGTLDSLDQGAFGLPLDTLVQDDGKVRFAKPAVGVAFEGTLQGNHIDGVFSQGAAKIPLVFTRGGPVAALRPQYPKGALPYRSEDVRISSPGAVLAGTFTHPAGSGPVPAILLVSGSGRLDRDETMFEQKPFLVLSDYLTRAGYAVLRLDKRGVGASTGDRAQETLDNLSSDALAAVAWLKVRPDVAPHRVGVLGHSEGGAVAALAAAAGAGDIDFVVMLGGPGEPIVDLLTEQTVGLVRAQGAPESVLAAEQDIARQEFEILKQEPDLGRARTRLQALAAAWRPKQPELADLLTGGMDRVLSPEVHSLLSYAPGETLRRISCPILAIYGGKDLQAPADSNARAAIEALTTGAAPTFTLVKLPGLNHLFQTAKTGSLAEYAQSEETMSPIALRTVSAWLDSVAR